MKPYQPLGRYTLGREHNALVRACMRHYLRRISRIHGAVLLSAWPINCDVKPDGRKVRL